MGGVKLNGLFHLSIEEEFLNTSLLQIHQLLSYTCLTSFFSAQHPRVYPDRPHLEHILEFEKYLYEKILTKND